MTASNAYRTCQVMGSSQLDLILVVYDALIRNLSLARDAAQAGEYADQAEYSMRAVSAIIELTSGLDQQGGGELSSSLGGLYSFMYKRLMECQVDKPVETMTEIIQLSETLREGWQDLSDQQQATPQHQFAGAVA